VLLGAYQYWSQANDQSSVKRIPIAHDQVIMYSLTTCGYCKQKGRELDRAGIEYKEYFIDKDHKRRDELTNKLKLAGFEPRSWGTPIMDIKGVMLPNNPSMKKIMKYLD
jgi:glutaredoxin